MYRVCEVENYVDWVCIWEIRLELSRILFWLSAIAMTSAGWARHSFLPHPRALPSCENAENKRLGRVLVFDCSNRYQCGRTKCVIGPKACVLEIPV